MKRDWPQRDHPAVYVAAFRHFHLIALFPPGKKNPALLQNFIYIFYFLKNS